MISQLSHGKALTIAGLDPSSFAGLSADLRTFASLGVLGLSAMTALTVQVPGQFDRVAPSPEDLLKEQIGCLLDCFGPMPCKIGLIPNSSVLEAVVSALAGFRGQPIVVDPIAGPSAGEIGFVPLSTLEERLLPLATLATPNLPEAESLLGACLGSPDAVRHASETLAQRFGCAVLLKGGHASDQNVVTDVLYSEGEIYSFESPRVSDVSVHGSGCFLSASITAFLARGFGLVDSIRMAKAHISRAFQDLVDVDGFPLLYSPS